MSSSQKHACLRLVQFCCIATVLMILGCDRGTDAKKKSDASNGHANTKVSIAKELATRQVHPLLNLKSARFGPCKKSSSVWKLPRGDHELVLVFEKPESEDGENLLNKVTNVQLFANGRFVPIYNLDFERMHTGSARISGKILVPATESETDLLELMIHGFHGNEEVLIFSKKFQVIKTPPRPIVKSAFPDLDQGLLRFPPGWNSFESKASSFNPIAEDKIPGLLELARGYMSSPARPHPHDLEKIPMAFIRCAAAKAKSGKTDEALEILEELQKHGGVMYELLDNNSSFDAIRDHVRYKAVYEFGKAEPKEDFYGKYLVRQPLLKLEDFTALKLSPPLPDLSGKMFIISTGGPHMFDDTPLVKGIEAGVAVHAIVSKGNKLELPEGVILHETLLAPEALVFDRTPIVWFGNNEGSIVAFLRPYSGEFYGESLIKYLKKQ